MSVSVVGERAGAMQRGYWFTMARRAVDLASPASVGRTAAERAVARLGARLMAHDLAEVGINVDCAPVLDVPAPGSHDIIGDRAYGTSPERVAEVRTRFARPVMKAIKIGAEADLIRTIALQKADALFLQLGAHGGIDVRIAAGDGMAGFARDQRDAAHEGAADAEDVDVHGQPRKMK